MRSQVAFRTAVVLELQRQLRLSFLWRINPSGGISGVVLLRVGVEARNQCSPDMTQIDAVADNLAGLVSLPSY